MSDLNNSLNTSVTIVQGCLILTLPNDMTDDELKIGSNKIIIRVYNSSIKGAILDFNMVSALDSYSFEVLKETSKAISLMGVMVVWSGIRPGVVSALLDLNVDVSAIKVAMNLEQALRMISDAQLNKFRRNR